MNLRIPFIAFAILLVFGIAYFIARVFTTGLRVSAHSSNGIIISTLIFPLVYILSLFSGRNNEYSIGPMLYTIINCIAGLFYYLFIGALIVGIVFIISQFTHFVVPTGLVWGILILSLLAGTVGLIQSRFITTRQYIVTLAGAPASWDGKTAVLVTDTHFGLVNHTKFSDTIISTILAIQPDFVLHAGDFYDGPNVDTAPISSSWKKLTSQLPVFYTPGNHEMYGNYNTFIDSIRAAGVTVLDDKVTTYEGVQIAGITYRGGKADTDAARALDMVTQDKTTPMILINHPPTSLDAAVADGVDLQVSGHTHNGQFWPNNFLVKKVYGVFGYGLNQYKTMSVITSSGVGTYGPPMRLFNPPELVVIQFKTK